MLKVFSTEHLKNIFAEEDRYDSVKNLMFDLAEGKEIYDEDKVVSTKEANDKVRSVVFEILGINKNSSKRDRNRAMKKHGNELYEVIEDVIDMQIATGFKESEFFNRFVEQRNLSLGDSQEFWTDDTVVLSVAKVAGDHHDILVQRLGEGQSYTVPTSAYAIAVGTDIDMYLTGRVDWQKLIDACAKAFVARVQTDIYTEMMAAAKKLPAQFQGTGALGKSTKDKFDGVVENVQIANDNAQVYIIGVKAALKKLNGLADIDWVSGSQKEQVAATGRLGDYEGVTLMEVPQRFKNNDIAHKLFSTDELLIVASPEDKFVKMVDVGETEILEITERGARKDDTMKYEVQREMGIGTSMGKYFGYWKITA